MLKTSPISPASIKARASHSWDMLRSTLPPCHGMPFASHAATIRSASTRLAAIGFSDTIPFGAGRFCGKNDHVGIELDGEDAVDDVELLVGIHLLGGAIAACGEAS